MLIAQGVESNPGPGPGSRSGQGQRNVTRAGTSYSSITSRGKGTGGAARGVIRRTSMEGVVPGSDRVLRSSESSQEIMSSWLNIDSDRRASDYSYDRRQSEARPELDTDYDTSNTNVGGAGGYDVDVKSVLLEIRTEVRRTNQKFDRLERTVNDLKDNYDTLKNEHDNLKINNDKLQGENEELRKKMDTLNTKVDQLENQSRRDNLIFHGLTDENNESWADSEAKVRQYIANDLGMDETDISFERAHRLNTRNSPRPIIVKFSHFKDREKVLREYRDQKLTAQGGEQPDDVSGQNRAIDSGVRVAEDFSARVRRTRRALYPFLRDYLKESRDAHIRFDKLVVDGVNYIYDDRLKKLVRE